MELTRDNYYTPEADWEYMSCSQYTAWLDCEARTMAKLKGYWADEPSDAFLVGNYFHTFFEGAEAHKQFCEDHFDSIYKTKSTKDKTTGLPIVTVTGKYAAFEKADKMINVAMSDDLIASIVGMPGENEKIMNGELFGIPWRIRIDKYVSDGRLIIDYKTCASIVDLHYSPSARDKLTFLDQYGYLSRAAVYSEIEKQYQRKADDPQFIIIAVSKQDPPDKDVLDLTHRERFNYELSLIKERLPQILRLKNGSLNPTRCDNCEYCRATKKIFAIRPYYTLMPEFRERRIDDYAEGSVLAQA